MWTMTIVIGVTAAVAVVVAVMASRRPRPSDPHAQPPTERAAHSDALPAPGSGDRARRPDGSLMPGSEAYRNERGKP